jgi:hypothetical protein
MCLKQSSGVPRDGSGELDAAIVVTVWRYERGVLGALIASRRVAPPAVSALKSLA